MITPKEKARKLILKFGRLLAIECCNEVLGDMGSDRGYAFWSEVKFQIEHWPKTKQMVCKDSD